MVPLYTLCLDFKTINESGIDAFILDCNQLLLFFEPVFLFICAVY